MSFILDNETVSKFMECYNDLEHTSIVQDYFVKFRQLSEINKLAISDISNLMTLFNSQNKPLPEWIQKYSQ